MKDAIIYRNAVYRLAQEPEDGAEMGEETKAPAKDFSFADWSPGEDGAAAMARMLVVGIAAKLARDGVDKNALKKAKLNEATAQFTSWLKAVAQLRTVVKEELRLLQRYGPSQYLQKKGSEIKAAG